MKVPVSSMMMSTGGVIVALNGALQKRFVLPRDTPLVPGNVHRIQEVQVGVGGKGQDVAIALSCLGYAKEQLKVAQFLGLGGEGDQVADMLEAMLGADAMSLTVRPQAPLRTCTSVVADDATTELVEPSGTISAEEMAQLMARLKELNGGAICIMGSMPPGCPPTTYSEIYKRVAGPETLCVIDSVAGLEPLFQAIASTEKQGSTIFKVNASELCTLAGVSKSNNEVDGIEPAELLAAISAFFAKFGPDAVQAISAIAITDGRHPAHLAALQDNKKVQIYQVPVTTLPKGRTLFPIGAGDAVAAGTLAAWQCLSSQQCLPSHLQKALESHSHSSIEASEDPVIATMLTALSFGISCGSASCLQEENSVVLVEEVLKLFATTKGKPTFLSSQSV